MVVNSVNTIINISIKRGKVKIIFKDSLQLLRGSLSKLSKDFKVQFAKDIFPHRFAVLENLYYSGSSPSDS